jgi:hypothetical protein
MLKAAEVREVLCIFGGLLNLFQDMIVLRRRINSRLVVRDNASVPRRGDIVRDEDGDGASDYMVRLGHIEFEKKI